MSFFLASSAVATSIAEEVGKEGWRPQNVKVRQGWSIFIGNDLHIENRYQNANNVFIVRKTS